jgi:hypothetical protein
MMSSILAPMPIVDCLALMGEVTAAAATPPPVVQLRMCQPLKRGAGDAGDGDGGGLLAPWMAGLGMSVSSAVVVINALRLERLPRRSHSLEMAH